MLGVPISMEETVMVAPPFTRPAYIETNLAFELYTPQVAIQISGMVTIELLLNFYIMKRKMDMEKREKMRGRIGKSGLNFNRTYGVDW